MKYTKRIICAGNGLTALNLALHLEPHTQLIILAATSWNHSNSYMAKGGISIPLNTEDKESHVEDTLMAGDGLCKEDVVRSLVADAPLIRQMIQKAGLVFDTSLSREGGHRVARVHHLADETGRYLMQAFEQYVLQKPNVEMWSAHRLLRVLVENGKCYGAEAWDGNTHKVIMLTADAVVLATGGCGKLYQYHTNASAALGEGYSIAAQVGAVVQHMEFVQFHPTRLYLPHSDTPLLITEAFRGAGAVLRDGAGHDVMHEVHTMGSLAPRDVVSRTMQRCMSQQQVSHLWLDFSAVDIRMMQQEFPALYALCVQHHFLAQRSLPVTPAAHYQCGGVVTDVFGRTSVDGLFAVGEVACTGLHGANRLASNSLMELMVISYRMAISFNDTHATGGLEISRSKETFSHVIPAHLDMIADVQQILWSYFGIIRTAEGMATGMHHLKELMQSFVSRCEVQDVTRLPQYHALSTALLIAGSASIRNQSKGCHYVEDDAIAFENQNAHLFSHSA